MHLFKHLMRLKAGDALCSARPQTQVSDTVAVLVLWLGAQYGTTSFLRVWWPDYQPFVLLEEKSGWSGTSSVRRLMKVVLRLQVSLVPYYFYLWLLMKVLDCLLGFSTYRSESTSSETTGAFKQVQINERARCQSINLILFVYLNACLLLVLLLHWFFFQARRHGRLKV